MEIPEKDTVFPNSHTEAPVCSATGEPKIIDPIVPDPPEDNVYLNSLTDTPACSATEGEPGPKGLGPLPNERAAKCEQRLMPGFPEGTSQLENSKGSAKNDGIPLVEYARAVLPRLYSNLEVVRAPYPAMGLARNRAFSPTAYKELFPRPRPNRITAVDIAKAVKQRFRFQVSGNCLYRYTGSCYVYMPPYEAYVIIREVCPEAVELSGTTKIIHEAYDLLLTDPDLVVNKKKGCQHYVAFKNCILDLRSGRLMAHTPDLFLTWSINANFNLNDTSSPQFDYFLTQLCGNDPELIERVWQLIGYCLVPDTDGKSFFILQGVSNSGKSTLIRVVVNLLDENAVATIEIHALSDKFNCAELVGKALCTSPDMPDEPLSPKAVSMLKKLTGGDLISADVKYHPRVQFYNTAKIITATNARFYSQREDAALMDRAVVVPCRYSIPRELQDPLLAQKFIPEYDAIATKAIAAYYELRRNHYRFAGDYPVNETIGNYGWSAGDPKADVRSMVQRYVYDFYDAVKDENAQVFIQDACFEFNAIYKMSLSENVFSTYFLDAAKEKGMLGKIRKRKPGSKNATSCICGLRHKEPYIL